MSAPHRGGPSATKRARVSRHAHQLEDEIRRALRRCVAQYLAGDREAARAAFDEARRLIASRSAIAVHELEVERGLA